MKASSSVCCITVAGSTGDPYNRSPHSVCSLFISACLFSHLSASILSLTLALFFLSPYCTPILSYFTVFKEIHTEGFWRFGFLLTLNVHPMRIEEAHPTHIRHSIYNVIKPGVVAQLKCSSMHKSIE